NTVNARPGLPAVGALEEAAGLEAVLALAVLDVLALAAQAGAHRPRRLRGAAGGPGLQLHRQFLRLAAAGVLDLHLIARLVGADLLDQRLVALHLLAAELGDDVLGQEAGAGGRALLGDRDQLGALDGLLGVLAGDAHVDAAGLLRRGRG